MLPIAHVAEASYPDVEEDEKIDVFIRLAAVHYHDLVERKSEISQDVVDRLERGLRVTEYALARRTQARKVRLHANSTYS
jgi:hypothetical protein